MEIVRTLRDATKVRSLHIAFELAEAAVSLGLEGDNYISPSRTGSQWVADVRDQDDNVIGYVRR